LPSFETLLALPLIAFIAVWETFPPNNFRDFT
jgi:hypothetical protein